MPYSYDRSFTAAAELTPMQQASSGDLLKSGAKFASELPKVLSRILGDTWQTSFKPNSNPMVGGCYVWAMPASRPGWKMFFELEFIKPINMMDDALLMNTGYMVTFSMIDDARNTIMSETVSNVRGLVLKNPMELLKKYARKMKDLYAR